MDVHIGDTLSRVHKDGKVTNHPIITEADRQLAIESLNRGIGYSLIKGSYLKDRSSFGPTAHNNVMFDGNVRVGGNAHVEKLAPSQD